MKRVFLLLTCLMMFGTMVFGQQPVPKWSSSDIVIPEDCDNPMSVTALVSIDKDVQATDQLEVAAFCNDELRGVNFTQFSSNKYLAYVQVYGVEKEIITFKMYDHRTGIIYENCVVNGNKVLVFKTDGYGTPSDPVDIKFNTPLHYVYNGEFGEDNMTITAVVQIEGTEQYSKYLELGAFCDNEVIGSAMTNYVYDDNGTDRYYANITVYGKENDVITFRLYDHITKTEIEFNDVNTVSYESNGMKGTYDDPFIVNFIKRSYVAKIGDKGYFTLQSAIDACVQGDNTIELLADISDDVTIKQVEGINVTIDGGTSRYDYTGTVTIHGNARYTGAETLTFKNIDFVTSEASHYFIDSNSTGSVERYAHNVTVENCNFTATENTAAVNSAAAMRIRQGFNIAINGGTFTGLHSVLQAYGNAGVTIDGITATNMKNGISLGTSKNVSISNSNIAAAGYGVRADGTGAYGVTMTSNNITADLPVVVRNTTGEYELAVNDGNTLVANNADGYQVVFTTGDDGTYVAPTANATATVNGDFKLFGFSARIGNVYYTTFDNAFAAASTADEIVILKTVVLSETKTINFASKKVDSEVNPAFRIINGATITVENGNMNTADDAYNFILGASDGSSAGNLVINSGEYHASTTVASVTEGTLTIKGGEFSATPYNGSYAFLINCIDANYKNGSANVEIEGGTFHNWNPQDNAAEGAGTNFCANGYISVDNGDGTWTVRQGVYVAQVNDGAKYESLVDAVAAAQAGDVVTLLTDATGAGLKINKNITVDFGGKTYTINQAVGSTGTESQGFQLLKNNTVTLKNGNIAIAEGTNVKWMFNAYADVTLENLNVNCANMAAPAENEANYVLVVNNGGSATPTVTYTNVIVTNFPSTATAQIWLDPTTTLKAGAGLEDSIKTQEGYVVVYNNGEYTAVPAVASITADGTTTYYETLAGAVEAATAGQTVNLLADATGAGLKINKDVTIDFGGFTYTINQAVGSTGTESQGFQLLKNNTVTLKNGNIAIAEGTNVKWMFNAYADVTLENLNVNCANMAAPAENEANYVLVVNNGGSATPTVTYTNVIVTNFPSTATAQIWLDPTTTLKAGAGLEDSIKTQEGYVVVYNNGVYTVARPVASITREGVTTEYATLGDATSAAVTGDVVNLLCDVNGGEIIVDYSHIVKKITVDLGGYTYTSTGTALVAFRSGTELTITNGTVNGNGAGGGTLRATYNATLILGAGLTVNAGPQATAIVIEDGKFFVNPNTENVIVNGGIDCIKVEEDALEVSIASGTYTEDVQQWCADGYVSINNGNGTWTVQHGVYVAEVGGVKYTSLQKAINAAQNGDVIKLINNINLTDSDLITLDGQYNTYFKVEGKTVTIDLNDFIITGYYDNSSVMLVGVFSTDNGGHLTLMDSGVSGEGKVDITSGENVYALIVNYEDGCSITVNGGTYKLDKAKDSHMYTGCNEGIIVNGGTFHLGNIGTGSNGQPWMFNAKGQNSAHVIVNGGTFNSDILHQHYPFEVMASKEKALKYSDVDKLYTMVEAVAYVNEQHKSGNWYTNEVGFATLEEAFAAAAKYNKDGAFTTSVTMLKDVKLGAYVTISESVNLNLAQFNITRENGTALYVNGTGIEVTIDGEGTVSGAQAVYVDNGTVTINGGNYVGGYEAVYVINNGHAVINGGTFGAENDEDDTDFVLNEYDATRDITTIAVKGGTFHGFDPENNAAEGAGTNFCAEGYVSDDNGNGTWTVRPGSYVAKVGDVKYETVAAAVAAATAGETVTLIADVTEDVTVGKSLTIDGANFKYTGNIAVSGTSTAMTVKNVNFVNGTYYAIKTDGINSITVEDCTVANYDWGFLYANKSTPTVVVKNVTVENAEYGFHWVYGTTATLENVTMTNVTNGLLIQNYASKTINLKNCVITTINIWERSGYSGVQTFNFEGASTVGSLTDSQYAKYVLAATDATLTAPEGLKVTTSVDESAVVYENGVYKVQEAVAKIGGTYYATLKAAIEAAQNGETVVVLKDITLGYEDANDYFDEKYKSFFNISGKAVTVNLNEKTVKAVLEGEETVMAFFSTENGGNLTIKGGNLEIETEEAVYSLLVCYTGGKLTVEDGNYKLNLASDDLVYTQEDNNVVINGGTFYLGNVGTGQNGQPWIINAKGQNSANVDVNGGTFNADINHQFWANEVYIPETKALRNNGDGTWTIVESVAYVEEIATSRNAYPRNVGYATLAEAVNPLGNPVNNTVNVTVIMSHELAETVIVNKNVNIDFAAGVELTTKAYPTAFRIIEGADVTVVNANIKTVDGGLYNFILGASDSSSEGNLTIMNGTFVANTTVASVTKGNLTIKGGDFSLVEGTTDFRYLINCIDANYKNGSAKVEIMGGTFHGFDPENNAAEGTGTNFCADGYISDDNGNGTWTVRPGSYVAQVGDVKYETVAAAVAAAKAGETVTLIANVTEDVTISKNLTIDGAGKNYTGNISVNNSVNKNVEATVKNVNFVNGTGYAITTNRIKSITVEDCTVANYGYGFLYANQSTPTVTVKNVTVDGGNYGFHWVYGTTATLENVTMTNVTYGLYIQNYASKTINVKNSNISSIAIWERVNKSGVQTFNFEGASTVGSLTDSQYAKYVLKAADATLTAPEGLEVTTSVEGYAVVYENGVYKVQEAVAKIGETYYATLKAAIEAAQAGETVTLLDDATGAGVVINKDITIDFGGYTYSFNEGVGSGSLTSNGFQILQGNDVVLKNGTLNVNADDADEFYILVQNYANLTVENMTLDGTNLDKWSTVENNWDSYTLSNNSGEVNIINTKIYANNEGVNAFAFDVDDNASYTSKPVVNVSGENTLVRGNVEVDLPENLNISGGLFTTAIAEAWCAEGYIPTTIVVDGITYYTVKLGEYVAQIKGGAKYESLVEAYDAAQSGATVKLLKNATGAGVVINKDITIDFGGFTYSFNDGVGSGSLTSNGFQILQGNDVVLKNGTLNVNADDADEFYILVQNYANLTVEDMTLDGTNLDKWSTVENNWDSYTLSNNSGEVNIINTKIYANNEGVNAFAFDVDDNASYTSKPVVNVSGENTLVRGNVEVDLPENLNISGGLFTNEIEDEWCAEGYIPTTEVVDEITYYTVKLGEYVAQINGGAKFETLVEAVAAAQAGETVTLLKSAIGAGVVINKDITIDFGGFTYTFNEGVGSTGTESNGFQILQGNDVVLNNGKLEVAETAKYNFYILVQNYANLTVEDMTLDGTNLDKWSLTDGDSYVLSNNSGTVNITGATNITANNDGENAFAFDVCKYANYAVPTVNVNTTGIIDGKIEVSPEIPTNLNISGGLFTNEIEDEWCAEGYVPTKDGEYWTVLYIITDMSRSFNKNWNWFSSYVNLSASDGSGLEKLQNALGTSGIIVKGQLNEVVNYEIIGYDQETGEAIYAWTGRSFAPLKNKMYMIKTSEAISADDFVINGELIDYRNTFIKLNKGWNWISYPVKDAVEINEALANLTPQDGDQIKSYTSFARYNASTGKWNSGSLKTMTPGEGYMYQSNNSKVVGFYYNVPETGSRAALKANVTAEDNHWVPTSNYANNMTMIAMLNIDGEMSGDDYEIAAFANGECRGSARPIYVEEMDAYMLFMVMYGEEVENLSFKYYDLNYGTEYELNEVVVYSNDAALGSIEEPYMFNLDFLGVGETSFDEISIYPNPTTTKAEIKLNATCEKVEVFNALGVKIAEYANVDTIDALETAGVYVIRVTNNGDVKNCRLVVK